MIDFIEKYRERNNSYSKTCIFNVGYDSGFFSEINHMIFSMAYCDKEKIKFTLYSDNANFSNENGWKEFFLPFCEENHSCLNRYNFRALRKNPIGIKRKIKKIRRLLRSFFVKRLCCVEYFTYDVFLGEDLKCFTSFEELSEVSYEYAKMVWHFNEHTQTEVTQLINSLNLPDNYMAIHVRRGDKLALEGQKTAEHLNYINQIKELGLSQNVFVFCDDYKDYLAVKELGSDYTFFTLCKSNEEGYFHQDFSKRPWKERRADMIKLFANIEILRKAEYTIGTRIANPSLFLNIIMPKEKFAYVEGGIA